MARNKELLNRYLYGFFDPSSPNEISARSDLLRTFNYVIIDEMNQDPIIAFAYKIISSIMVSLPYTVRSEDEFQEALIRDALKKHYTEVMSGFCTAVYNGYAFSQKIYTKEDKHYRKEVQGTSGKLKYETIYKGPVDTISRIKWISPKCSNVEYFVNRRTEELKYIKQRQYLNPFDTELSTTKETNTDLIVKRNNLIWFAGDYPFDKIFGRSRYLNIYLSWEIIKVLNRYLLEGVDANASPLIGIKYPERHINMDGKMVHALDIAREQLEAFENGLNYYAIPSTHDKDGNQEWEVLIQKDAAAAGADIYNTIKDLIIMHYNFIMMGLFLPPALNPVDESKSLGDSETSMELLMLVSEPFVTHIEKVFRTDFIDDILAMNVPEEDLVPYRFEIDKSIFNRRSLMKELVKQLVTIAGQGLVQGTAISEYMPDLRSILEQLNIPHERIEEIFKTVTPSDGTVKSYDIEKKIKEQDKARKEAAEMAKMQPSESPEEEGTGNGATVKEIDTSGQNKIREESRTAERTPRTIKNGKRDKNIPGA